MKYGSFPPDESYRPVLVVGGVSAGAGAGAGVGAAAAGRLVRRRCGGGAAAGAAEAGGAAAVGPFKRSAASRLTLDTVVAAGPTGPATAFPTVIFSASGLPVFSTGAVALAGTV